MRFMGEKAAAKLSDPFILDKDRSVWGSLRLAPIICKHDIDDKTA